MVSVLALMLFFLGCMFIVTQSAPRALSVVLSRPEEASGFPFFHFITGLFYGFIAGMIFTGYLTWKYILKPHPSTVVHSNKGVGRAVSPKHKKVVKVKNALVQGPVTYNPQFYTHKKYDDLAHKHWGAWWY